MPDVSISTVRSVFRFPILSRLWRYILAVAIYSALVVMFGRGLVGEKYDDRTGEAVVAGIVFGWLMSFRTHVAYSRWWEARGLWGQLVNDTRNLMLKAAVFLPDPTERAKLGATLVRFAQALSDHLRLPRGAAGPHLPMAIAGEVYHLVRTWYEEGRIDGYMFLTLDEHARQLMNICGACEKIRSTPLAPSYRALLRKGITAYLLLLPWMVNDEIGWLTVPVEVLVAYAVVALELIATSIEDPFGTDGDDLAIDHIVEVIRKSV